MVSLLIGSLTLFMGFLLISNYQAEMKLRRSSAEYFHQHAQREALKASQFFRSTESILRRLAESRSLDTYYENKALGMSMEYGLKASLMAVHKEFERTLEEVRIGEQKSLKAIEFVTKEGAVLVTTDQKMTTSLFEQLPSELKAITNKQATYFVLDKQGHPKIFLSVPYVFKGVVIGRVLAVFLNESFRNVLLTEMQGTVREEVGLGYEGQYLSLLHETEEDPTCLFMKAHHQKCETAKEGQPFTICKGASVEKGDIVLFEVPIEGTPFELLVAIPSKIFWGSGSPLNSLLLFAVLFVFLCTVLLMLWRTSLHNVVLQDNLFDQERRANEIEEKVKARTIELRRINEQFEREIAERKKAEEGLKEAKEKADKGAAWWRSLVQEVPAVTFVLGREGEIRSVNRAFAGMSADALVGRSLYELLDLHEGEVLKEALSRVFNNKASERYESRVVFQNQVVWYENHVGPIESNGEVAGALCLSFDITEKKIADDLLREMSLAVEHSPVSVVITDRFGKIEYVNPRFTIATGYRFDEIYGQLLRIFREGEIPAQVQATLWNTIRGGKEWRGEYCERRKDGGEFWELVTISPVVDAKGETSHFIILKEDITERRRAQEEKEADLNFLRDLLDAIPSPVFYKDREGIYRGCNKAFEEYLGKPRSEIIGSGVYDIAPKELADIYFRSDEIVLQKGGRHVYEAKVRYADGGTHDVMFFKSVLNDKKGEARGLIGVMLDITEHKKMETELRMNETQLISALEEVKMFNLQLEQAQGHLVQQEKLAAIGFLAAGVAHEINNPLGFVHGNLSALEEYAAAFVEMSGFLKAITAAVGEGDLRKAVEIKEKLEAAERRLEMDYIEKDVKNLLSETQEGVERIKKIVQGLKSFSRADSGEKVSASIHDVIDGVLNIVWNEIKYRAELVKEYGEVPLISGNPQQLGQVFVNLLVNAAQAIDEHGKITIRTFVEKNEVVV